MDDELLPIGRFARLAGLTVGALRHYDEEGVLRPAHVDPATGYRRYRPDQLATARAVAALRELELSLPAIRAVLEADDPAVRGAVLRDERVRLEARTARLQRALHRLSVLSATHPTSKEIAVPTPPPPPSLSPETHRSLGAGLYNRTWDLLEIEGRTPAQDDELVDTAHASAWHWRQVGNAANTARAHWLCSRVYAVLGRGEAAVHHARRANEVLAAGGEGIEDWDAAAAAAEAMARALAVSGDRDGAAEWKARASAALAAIAEAEDRASIEGDLATIPA
ncbi:MAG: helix-turn-helix domain-containing protein [Chloroflexota bacterium]